VLFAFQRCVSVWYTVGLIFQAVLPNTFRASSTCITHEGAWEAMTQ
jgi:hypothetical protein